MSKLTLGACLLFIVLTSFARKSDEINALMHDKSFIATFGVLPNGFTNEKLRIQTHLSYVENLLRAKSVSYLTPLQYRNRRFILDKLHTYWTAGVFPLNADYPGERKSCFIDANGNICAVGYLVAETRGIALAEQINQAHQYDLVMDINEPVIETWADSYGLTLEECAMIQPLYEYPLPTQETINADVRSGYGISSALIGGGMIGVNIVNFRKSRKTLSWIGMLGGATQIILGTANVRKPQYQYFGGVNPGRSKTIYKSQNNLSYANIALGSAGIITNAVNLVLQRKNKDQRNAYNLYSYPNYANSVSLGFFIRRRI